MLAAFATILSIFGCWWLIHCPALDDATLRGVASAYASVGVTMLGFMLAMLAVLVSVSDRKLLRNMNKTGHLKQLLKKVYWTGAYFGLSMICSLAALFLTATPLIYSVSIATGALVGALSLLFFVGRSFWRVLTLSPDPSTPLE